MLLLTSSFNPPLNFNERSGHLMACLIYLWVDHKRFSRLTLTSIYLKIHSLQEDSILYRLREANDQTKPSKSGALFYRNAI